MESQFILPASAWLETTYGTPVKPIQWSRFIEREQMRVAKAVAALPSGGWCIQYAAAGRPTVLREIIGWIVYDDGSCFAMHCDETGKVREIEPEGEFRLIPPSQTIKETFRY